MSTINVTLSEDLYMQIIMLAAHDGVTPSQYLAATMAEKVETVEIISGFTTLGRLKCAESSARTLTIVPLSDTSTVIHDHLLPYHRA